MADSSPPSPKLIPSPSSSYSLTNALLTTLIPIINNESRNESILGPTRDPPSTVIPMTLIYTVILVTGVVGNICTCVVIARNKYMHTATNYYLFSLAVSDLLLLILGLPQEMYHLWQRYPYIFGEFFCIFRGLTSESSTNASILTITAFTVERYLAICHPLRAHTMSKLSRAVMAIIIIWLVSAMCAVPLAIQFGIVHVFCTLKSPLSHAFEISTFLFFILPMTLITVLYVLIGIKLRRSTGLDHTLRRPTGLDRSETPSNTLNGAKSLTRQSVKGSNQSSRRAVVKMLVAVVVAFFICWAPFHAQRLMAIYVTEPTSTDKKVYDVLNYISGVSYYFSATINPILYSILSVKFRQAFKDTITKCCGCRQRRSGTPPSGSVVCLWTYNAKNRVSIPVMGRAQIAHCVTLWLIQKQQLIQGLLEGNERPEEVLRIRFLNLDTRNTQ